jgi:hypothetical protein
LAVVVRDQPPTLAALPQSQFGSFGGKKYLLAMLEINPQLLGHPACNLVTVLTWLFPAPNRRVGFILLDFTTSHIFACQL